MTDTFRDALQHLPTGRKSRLLSLLDRTGGRLAILPIDQGLEHGPIDFLDVPEAGDPHHPFRLAVEGGFSAIATHVGLADAYLPDYAGRIPLVLKLNGKTGVPADDEPFSPLTGSVEDALRLNAAAVGYTLYVGSPAQDRDIAQLAQVRGQAHRYGLPLIVWAYPRGRDIEAAGGRDSPFAVEYAARAAHELGADIVKVNVPAYDPTKAASYPGPYRDLAVDEEQAMRRVVAAAGRCLVIASGGTRVRPDEALDQARLALRAGCAGVIFGRNVWQRPYDEALALARRLVSSVRDDG